MRFDLTLPPVGRTVLFLLLAAGCSRPGGPPPRTAPAPDDGGDSTAVAPEEPEEERPEPRATAPFADPRIAMRVGLMPHASMGVDRFRADNPTFDGRGVLIGVLDTGVDLGLPGFATTTTGQPKVVDARDFSGEGRVRLSPMAAVSGDSVVVGGVSLTGFSLVAGHATGPYYTGVFHERPLDVDINDNRSRGDSFPVIVGKTSSGWAVFVDGDGDGSLLDEAPVHDFLVAGESFTFSTRNDQHHRGPMTIAANFTEQNGRPQLDLFFDNGAHGSHVGGITAGHDMFRVEGFDGVAPGAQILALKIANSLRGGITVTGSILRAMNYAAEFAQRRGQPLVLNLSFGVGNQSEGLAAIDSMVTEYVLKHPDVLFVISAGNDGPGISTVGFPGSAPHAFTVCALFPGAFTGPRPQGFAVDADMIASFSARGGELAKPEICAPGVAFSNVPPWNLGNEVSGGTSMAAPQIAGLAALLQSASVQTGNPARAVELQAAIMASARSARAGTRVDMGAGVPRAQVALEWLRAGHQAGRYEITALSDGGNSSIRDASYRRAGLASEADTLQRFTIRSVAGQPAANFILRSDQRWLRAPRTFELRGGPGTIQVAFDPSRLRTPGMYVGTVWATPASDTLAGPAFRLTNTIIVPQSIDQPFAEGRDLGPGRLRRYFFEIPEESGGFTVEMELRYRTQTGSMYLFEPTGQPFRGGSSLDAGGGEPPKVRAVVNAEDAIPGVWEVVVVAPPTSALSYELRAALPRYTVEQIANGPTAVVRMRDDPSSFVQAATVFQRTGDFPVFQDSLQVVGQVVGAQKIQNVTGRGSDPIHLPLDVPMWARELEVQVRLPTGAWEQYTDLGVTVFDSIGTKLAEGPLSYETGRMTMDLRRSQRGATLDLELFPAFAHLEPPAGWEAEVTVTYLRGTPARLELTGVDTTRALAMDPGQTVTLQFSPVEASVEIPSGFDMLVEVGTVPAGGAPATRRRALSR